MTITFPRDVPLEEFSQVDVEGVDINAIQVSTFTGKERPQEFDGDYWRMRLVYLNLDVTLGRQVSSFVYSLRKTVGTFVLRFPGYGKPLGSAKDLAVTPLVDGGGQAGKRVLNIKNVPASVQGFLLAGDIVQVGPDNRPHWHCVLSDVDTTSAGKASIDVWPAIRSTSIDNDILVLTEPKGICRMRTVPKIPINPPVLYDISIECREATG